MIFCIPESQERESCLLKQSIQFPYSRSVLLFEIEYTHQMIINTSTFGALRETVHMGFSHLRKHISLIYTGHSQIDAYFSLQVLTRQDNNSQHCSTSQTIVNVIFRPLNQFPGGPNTGKVLSSL